jgi:DNA polymerase I-like protein with 3'-5' exonuclease and polymerase domains|tara:strand:- start:11652 stop:13469 length:1818 start_codon:yes stop_codon:yes gene_type:complete
MRCVAGVAGVAGINGHHDTKHPVTGESIPIAYLTDESEAASQLQNLFDSGGIYGIDTETQPRPGHEDNPKAGLSPVTGKLRLVQITDGESVVVLDMNHISAATLKPLEDARLVFHNVQFDLSFLLDAGIKVKHPACTQLAVASLTHAPMVSLVSACEEYLGISIEKEKQTSDWTLDELSQEQIQYAALDAVLTLSLYHVLKKRISMAAYRLVRKCIPAIAEASTRGVLIDRQKHQTLVNQWQQEKQEAVEKLRGLVGDDVNLESGKQLSDWLRHNLDGFEWPVTPKGQLRTDKDTLEAFSHIELVRPLLEYRRVSHRLKTWGETYERHMTSDNRLHPNFLLLGARSGRMSCRNPNFQNIPRDAAFRECFIAPDGYKIVTADFSQIELRIAGVLSADPVILNAYQEGKDLHRAIVSRVTGKAVDEISADERKLGKALNFSLLYGAGAKTFQTRAQVDYGIEISLEKAERFKEVFDNTYSTLRWWQSEKQRDAERTGSFTTVGGRLCTYKDQKHVYTESRNYPIQSAAADLQLSAIARCALAIQNLPAYMINFVHDELVLEVREDAIDQLSTILKEEMTAAFTDFFPDAATDGLVEIGVGDNYAEAK